MTRVSQTIVLAIGLMMAGGILSAKSVQKCHEEYESCKAKCSETDKKCKNKCAKTYASCRGISVEDSGSAGTPGKRMPLVGP